MKKDGKNMSSTNDLVTIDCESASGNQDEGGDNSQGSSEDYQYGRILPPIDRNSDAAKHKPTFVSLSSSSSSSSSSGSSFASPGTANTFNPSPRSESKETRVAQVDGSFNLRRSRAESNASDGSIPSLHAQFIQQTTSHHRRTSVNIDGPSDGIPPDGGNGISDQTGLDNTASVSADQERQILLLMLLAQVCALHDATPRTFTVHVLELWERGILDRPSIHFMFELGLVPLLSQTANHQRLRAPSAMATNGGPHGRPNIETVRDELGMGESSDVKRLSSVETVQSTEETQELVIVPRVPMQLGHSELRSLEASAIRMSLARLDELHTKKQRQKKQKQKDHRPNASPPPPLDQSINHEASKPWDVEFFPLSLSRYQREFSQVCLLNAGAFGQVFRATSKMDGFDYAIKKVQFDATGYSNEAIKQVIREVHCLAQVNDHPNIVRYYTSWLEPSWMTGSASGPALDVSNGGATIPQHQLLADLQQLMNTDSDPNIIENSRGSSKSSRSLIGCSSKRYEWDSSVFTDDISVSYGLNRRQRFSFDNSSDSDSEGWENRHKRNNTFSKDYSKDDSYLPSYCGVSMKMLEERRRNYINAQRQQQPQTQTQESPVYRYQICLFIQMQLCHPATLADWIRQRNLHVSDSNHSSRIGPALDIFLQIASGLAYVHKKGIIHRDLKPANVFASNDGHIIKIGDFGLSKQLEGVSVSKPHNPAKAKTRTTSRPSPSPSQLTDNDHNVSHVIVRKAETALPPSSPEQWEQKCDAIVPVLGALQLDPPVSLHADRLTEGIGTASYASPEQLKSQSYGTSADIFSLGLIFLELLCCFETEHERLDHFQRCRRQQLPGWLENKYPKFGSIILACTHPDPQARPTAQAICDTWSMTSSSPPSAANQAGTTIIPALQALRGQLEEKDEQIARHRNELAEKDRIIEQMRQEMERMRSTSTAASLGTTEP